MLGALTNFSLCYFGGRVLTFKIIDVFFSFDLMYVCVGGCLHSGLCVMCVKCPYWPAGGTRSTENGLAKGCGVAICIVALIV